MSAMLRLSIVAIALAVATPASGAGLSVDFTTTPNGGPYAPKNIVVVWIEDASGAFVKTIGRWSATRTSHLVAWIASSGSDTDAVTSATRPNHVNPLRVVWDLKDRSGTVVPDGTYTIHMELADSNSTMPSQNHEGTFTFVKGPTGSSQPGLTNGGFINVTVTYTAAAQCNNGMVDVGETCDGNCPTSCQASTDACKPITMQGAAATCDAVCVETEITDCVDGDGCCAAGCTADNDSDCAGGPSGSVEGGCSAAQGTPALGIALAMLLLGRRRRR